LATNFDLHAFRMRHRIGFAAKIHDGMRHTTGDVDECKIAEFAIGAI